MQYRFFLIREDNPIQVEEPVGFDKFAPKLKRDENYHGAMWEFAVQKLKFVAQGYELCRQAYQENGIEADVIFVLEWLCSGSEEWKELYRGQLDFAQYEEGYENYCYVDIGIAQTGVQMTLKSRSDTIVDVNSNVSFDGVALPELQNLSRKISIPAKTVKMRSRYEREYDGVVFNPQTNILGYYFPQEISSEFVEFSDNGSFIQVQNVNDVPPLFTVPEKDILYTNSYINARIAVRLWTQTYLKPSIVTASVYFFLRKNDELSLLGQFSDLEENNLASVYVDLMLTNYAINLSKDDKISLFMVYAIQGSYDVAKLCRGETQFAPIKEFFEIKTNSQYQATDCETVFLHEALDNTVKIITDRQLTVKTDLYGRTDSNVNAADADGCASIRAITNGGNLRQLTLTDGSKPKIQVKFKDLISSLDAIDCIGYGLEENNTVLRIEPYKYFYNDEVVMSCTKIASLSREINPKKCFQQLNIGYKKWQSEDVNGIDAFHSNRQYRTRLKMIDTKLEKTSSFITDGYAIELTRRKMLDSETKDWKYDNDLFLLDLKRSGNSFQVNVGMTGADNTLIDEATVFNGMLSPARMAMKWYSIFMQGVNYFTDKMIFSGGDGYLNAKGNVIEKQACTPNADILSENENIDASMFQNEEEATPIFLPETVEFEYPFTIADFENIHENPYGLVEFDGQHGWINSVEFKIREGIAKFILTPKGCLSVVPPIPNTPPSPPELPYIVINGLKWARYNLEVDGVFEFTYSEAIEQAEANDGRLPTQQEYNALLDLGYTMQNDEFGRGVWVGEDSELKENSNHSVFFPVIGINYELYRTSTRYQERSIAAYFTMNAAYVSNIVQDNSHLSVKLILN